MKRSPLDIVERLGNLLPDPALLFVWGWLAIAGLSWGLSGQPFAEIDPRDNQPIEVVNQLAPDRLVAFLSNSVKTFVEFPPLGMVLVALLGVGVAEHSGFVRAGLRTLLTITPTKWLTPMLLLVGLLSHAAGDSGYVVVIPLGGVLFAAAGRHPLLGICAAFAGISGGFSAGLLPSGIDPLLQGFTQKAAQIVDPQATVNPLCNWYFMAGSSGLIVLLGWFVTDVLLEPRLRLVPVDGTDLPPPLAPLTSREQLGLIAGVGVLVALLVTLWIWAAPATSAWRDPASRELVSSGSPLMKALVPLIALIFLLPGLTFGYIAGTFRTHRDVIAAMSKSMGTMSYYLVMAFCAAQFTALFGESKLGVLTAVKGALFLKSLNLPPQLTILAIILLTAGLDLLIGSASAKWALIGPILVPMLMSVGISPDLTQAAYRIGDSTINIVTPLMPYFPLVVMYARRYVQSTGVGTLVSLMLPYSLLFLAGWSLLLLGWWQLDLPLGLEADYLWPRR